MFVSSLALAGGRETVEAIENDPVASALVTSVIKSRGLQCKKPNLVNADGKLNVADFEIKYDCTYTSTGGAASMLLGGDVEDSQVTITKFSFKK